MKIVRFEDIDAWKESRKLVNTVYSLTSNKKFYYDFGLKEQIQRLLFLVCPMLQKDFIAIRINNLFSTWSILDALVLKFSLSSIRLWIRSTSAKATSRIAMYKRKRLGG